MANKAVLTISPPAANASWKLQFPGPAIRCLPISESMQQDIRNNLFLYVRDSTSSATLPEYLGWSPYYLRPNTSHLPYIPRSTNGGGLRFPDQGLDVPEAIFYMFMPSTALLARYCKSGNKESTWLEDLARASPSALPDWWDGTVLSCNILSATYEVTFNYTNGAQNVDILTSAYGAINIATAAPITEGLSGSSAQQDKNCAKIDSLENQGSNCSYNGEILRILSYQAIWHAFTGTLEGYIENTAMSQNPKGAHKRSEDGIAADPRASLPAEQPNSGPVRDLARCVGGH